MNRKSLTIWETKLEKVYEQNGICPSCGEPVSVTDGELAHRIPQRKWLLKMYGPGVIHHRMNVVLTHHGECNDKMSIANSPMKIEKLVEEIRKERKER